MIYFYYLFKDKATLGSDLSVKRCYTKKKDINTLKIVLYLFSFFFGCLHDKHMGLG